MRNKLEKIVSFTLVIFIFLVSQTTIASQDSESEFTVPREEAKNTAKAKKERDKYTPVIIRMYAEDKRPDAEGTEILKSLWKVQSDLLLDEIAPLERDRWRKLKPLLDLAGEEDVYDQDDVSRISAAESRYRERFLGSDR